MIDSKSHARVENGSGSYNWHVTRVVVVFTFVAAVAVFCIVQDRVTAGGARRYAELARAAIARHQRVNVDEVMRPAVHRSVRLGLSSAGAVLLTGAAVAVAVSRSGRGPRRG